MPQKSDLFLNELTLTIFHLQAMACKNFDYHFDELQVLFDAWREDYYAIKIHFNKLEAPRRPSFNLGNIDEAIIKANGITSS